jgi:hypothetical protein
MRERLPDIEDIEDIEDISSMLHKRKRIVLG